jgi:hypothetical protein
MTEFSIAHEFATDADTFWRVFLDGKFLEEWYRSGGLVRRELSRNDEGDRLVVVSRYEAQQQPPALVRSIFGGKPFGYTETASFIKSAARLEHRIEMSVMPDRVDFGGHIVLEPVAPGRVRQRYSGKIAVNLPLIGKKIEQATVKEMERTQAKAADVTRAWLGRSAS